MSVSTVGEPGLSSGRSRSVAIVTGASRAIGIGASIAMALAESGWDLAVTFWRPYDASMSWGSDPEDVRALCVRLEGLGARVAAIEADLSVVGSESLMFDVAENDLEPVTALVMSHCYCVEAGILATSVESFDVHFAANARATWLLVREFGRRFRGEPGTGRVISITSDHTAGNLPHGASKGAMGPPGSSGRRASQRTSSIPALPTPAG